VRGQLPNTDRFFWPGQFVNVRLILDAIPKAKLVPAQAIQIGEKSSYVFVVKENGTVDSRDIVEGERYGANIVVTKGLEAGETVVLTGQLNLATGAKVKIVSSNS
jgi:multidrug efflux system membrane fusion protein